MANNRRIRLASESTETLCPSTGSGGGAMNDSGIEVRLETSVVRLTNDSTSSGGRDAQTGNTLVLDDLEEEEDEPIAQDRKRRRIDSDSSNPEEETDMAALPSGSFPLMVPRFVPESVARLPKFELDDAALSCFESEIEPFNVHEVNARLPPSERMRTKKAEQVDNVGFVTYTHDTYLQRRVLETWYHPVNCLQKQSQITPGLRAQLVAWMWRLHHKLHLCTETLFLAVNILDRFLQATPISLDCFQLLGIAVFLVAGKKEEVHPPLISDLLEASSEPFNRRQVKRLELMLLSHVQFRLMAPTAAFFLEYHAATRIHTAALVPCSVEQVRLTRALARYVLELTLQDYSICQTAPSLLALAALELADEYHRHLTRLGPHYTGGYSRRALDDCTDRLRILLRHAVTKDITPLLQRYVNLCGLEDY